MPDVTNEESTDSVGVEPRKWTFTIVDNGPIEDETLSVYAKMVYVVLSYHADRNNHTCYPSIDRIAAKSGCKRTKVFEALTELVEAGYLKRRQRKDPKNPKRTLGNIYTILDPVRHTDGGSPPHGRDPVRHTDGNDTHFNNNQRTNDGEDMVDPEIVNNLVNGIASSLSASPLPKPRFDMPIADIRRLFASLKPKTKALFKELRINAKDQVNHLNKYGEDRVLAALEYTKRQGPSNPGGYLNKLLRTNAILDPVQDDQDDEWDPFGERKRKHEQQVYMLERLEEARERKGETDDGGLYRRIKAMIDDGYLDDAREEMIVYEDMKVYTDGEWKPLAAVMG